MDNPPREGTPEEKAKALDNMRKVLEKLREYGPGWQEYYRIGLKNVNKVASQVEDAATILHSMGIKLDPRILKKWGITQPVGAPPSNHPKRVRNSEVYSILNKYIDLPYTTILKEDAGGNFIASVKELKGCVVVGGSQSESLEKLESMKRLWLESCIEDGDEVPLPEEEKL